MCALAIELHAGLEFDNTLTVEKLNAAWTGATGLLVGQAEDTQIEDGAITLAKLAADVIAMICPPGKMAMFANETVPDGWLELGGVGNRTTHAALFAAIGTRWGDGDGTTTFDLPPRGYFFRSWDHGAGNDPDAADRVALGTETAGDHVGTVQTDGMKAHVHTTPIGTLFSENAPAFGQNAAIANVVGLDNHDHDNTAPYSDKKVIERTDDPVDGGYGEDSTFADVTAGDTRPVNVSVLFCIKT